MFRTQDTKNSLRDIEVKFYMRKGSAHTLHAADIEAEEYLNGIKLGEVVSCDIKKARNYKYHQKLFVLVTHAFEAWNPPEVEYRGHIVQKNFEKFRKDITSAAGYYTPSINLKGEVQAIPDSWAFGNMSEEKFEKMYSAIIDVILQTVLAHYTRENLDQVVDEILRFA